MFQKILPVTGLLAALFFIATPAHACDYSGNGDYVCEGGTSTGSQTPSPTTPTEPPPPVVAPPVEQPPPVVVVPPPRDTGPVTPGRALEDSRVAQ